MLLLPANCGRVTQISMNKDISPIIEGWEYKPSGLPVRRIVGEDGKEKIQLRLDLGLLQMEIQGRPDGKRPFGRESLLEHYLSQVKDHKVKHGSDDNFKLNGDDCAKLRQEGIQYYHRYLSFFELENYEGAQRDTARNLRVFDLIKKYAADEKDVMTLEQFRPSVLMMNTRAQAAIDLARKEYERALARVEEGIAKIKVFYNESGQEQFFESSWEVVLLKDLFKEIEFSKPLTRQDKLEQQLKDAIEKEVYEEAARIRDELQKIMDTEIEEGIKRIDMEGIAD